MMNKDLSLFEVFQHMLPWVMMVEGARYVAATSLMMAILFVAHRKWKFAQKIQSRRATRSDYRREIVGSLKSIIVYSGVATIGVWAMSKGYGTNAYSGSRHWSVVLVYVACLLVVHDCYFYFTHRLMHTRVLYRKFHRHHHRSVTPTPYAAYSFSMGEAAVQALMPVLWFFFVPTPFIAMTIFLVIVMLMNVWGHSGTELRPPGFAKHWFWGNFTTTVYHDMHHSGNINSNFGLYFTWWDRLFGTENQSYQETYRKVTEQGRQSEAAESGASVQT
jgi:Delta7-sterol 5-desaturase